MKNFIAVGDRLTITAPADIVSGEGVLAGTLFGVAEGAAATGAEVVLKLTGVFDLPKAPSEEWTVGAAVHWDPAEGRCTTVATGNPLIGAAVRAVGDTPLETVGRVRLTVVAPLRLQRRGTELRLVLGGAAAPSPRPDPQLLRTLIEARSRVANYLDPELGLTVSDMADREGVHVGDVSRSLQLACLAPDLVESILDGTQPLALTAERLKRIGELPLLWEEQRALLA